MRLLAALLLALLFCNAAHAQQTVRGTDPCFANLPTSVSVNISSATTTSVVSISGTKVVYVCGFALTIAPSATADTAQFEYGTGAACSSPTALTGTFGNGVTVAASSAIAQTVAHGGAGGTLFVAPSGTGLCILSAGSAVNIQGVVTYVQQ